MYRYAFSILISFMITLSFKSPIISMMKNHSFTAKNYSGRTVINGGGLVFLFPCLLGILPFWDRDRGTDLLLYVIVIISSLLMGLMDDFLGESNIKGFKGHLSMLFRGQLTTGMMKIMLGIISGLFVSSFIYTSFLPIGFSAILYALCLNDMNLMDLRPGRTIKAFLLFLVLLVLITGFNDLWILLPAVTAIAVYIPGEMKEEYMLGDTGANLLGGVLGLYIIRIPQVHIKLTVFFILLLIQIIGEFYSLSKIINSVPWLRSIDSIGRLEKER